MKATPTHKEDHTPGNGPLPELTREEADEKIRELYTMDTQQLTRLWAALFGGYCYTRRKDFIRRRLEWRINTLVSGGISERAMKRAEELADDTLLRVKSRAFKEREAPTPPTARKAPRIISKLYKGITYTVYQTERGFEYAGQRYATLSEVSTKIAGYYISGNKFFGLTSAQLKNF